MKMLLTAWLGAFFCALIALLIAGRPEGRPLRILGEDAQNRIIL